MAGATLGEEAAPALEASGKRVLLQSLGNEELWEIPKQKRVKI